MADKVVAQWEARGAFDDVTTPLTFRRTPSCCRMTRRIHSQSSHQTLVAIRYRGSVDAPMTATGDKRDCRHDSDEASGWRAKPSRPISKRCSRLPLKYPEIRSPLA